MSTPPPLLCGPLKNGTANLTKIIDDLFLLGKTVGLPQEVSQGMVPVIRNSQLSIIFKSPSIFMELRTQLKNRNKILAHAKGGPR